MNGNQMPLHSDAKGHRLRVIQAKTEEAAQHIAALPVERWGQWAVHLLKVLDSIAQERGEREAYNEVLDVVQRDILTRLDRKQW